MAGCATGGRLREVTVLGSTADLLPIRHMKLSQGSFLAKGSERSAQIVLGSVLAREFFAGVLRDGRSNEMPMMIRFFLKTNPLRMLQNAPVAWRLWRTGRLALRRERTRRRDSVGALLRAAKAAEGGDTP